jgi:hypothetical protein
LEGLTLGHSKAGKEAKDIGIVMSVWLKMFLD